MMAKYGDKLRGLSFGKYSTKLYFGSKQDSYSTITGGIFTIFFAFTVVATSLNILYQTINWKNYQMTTTYTDLNTVNETLKVGDLKDVLLGMRF